MTKKILCLVLALVMALSMLACGAKKEAAPENAPIVAAIHEALTADAQTASQIAAIVGCSHNKVTPLVKGLVADGIAVMTKVKVPGKGEQNGYALAPVDAE